jgi:hypothetical protein
MTGQHRVAVRQAEDPALEPGGAVLRAEACR